MLNKQDKNTYSKEYPVVPLFENGEYSQIKHKLTERRENKKPVAIKILERNYYQVYRRDLAYKSPSKNHIGIFHKDYDKKLTKELKKQSSTKINIGIYHQEFIITNDIADYKNGSITLNDIKRIGFTDEEKGKIKPDNCEKLSWYQLDKEYYIYQFDKYYIDKAIEKISSQFTKKYNVITHNCQDFVEDVIKEAHSLAIECHDAETTNILVPLPKHF